MKINKTVSLDHRVIILIQEYVQKELDIPFDSCNFSRVVEDLILQAFKFRYLYLTIQNLKQPEYFLPNKQIFLRQINL